MADAARGARPKRHHYVPQWHLRRFAAGRGLVWRYSKSADEYVRISVRNAAVIGHYYSAPSAERSSEPDPGA